MQKRGMIKMENTDIQEAVVRHQEQIKTLFERMGNLEKLTDSVHNLAISLERLTAQQSATESQVANLAADVDEIKGKPAKRWDMVVAAVISALVGAGIAFLVK